MRRTQVSVQSSATGKTQRGEGLTRAKRVVGSPELFARSKIITLGGDALEVIRVVLEAIPDIRCALGRRR